ncbi:MAG: maleylpyruvate isomerase family mycothiol-dependent enzyme [Streptosporangiaceae bacterium]
MDAAQRQLSDQLDQATQRLLDAARVITEPDLREPSLLEGWTRAHVLAHLARGGDAMRRVLAGVRSGHDRPAYTSAQARQAEIEESAARPAKDLMDDVADSAMALRTVARQLPGDRWQVPVRILDSAPFPAAQLLTRRLVEVELHHCDLGIGYGPERWPIAFTAMELPEPMHSQRQDRLGYPESAQTARPLRPPRPAPPYRPNQPLPGSWIGSRGQRADRLSSTVALRRAQSQARKARRSSCDAGRRI